MRRLCDGKRGGVLVLRYGTLLLSSHLALRSILTAEAVRRQSHLMCVNAVFATFGHCFFPTESLRLLYDTCAFCIALSGCPELVTCGEVDGAGHARVSIAQS